MNRPSLYGAFGDEHALHRHTLDRYRALAREAPGEPLVYGKPLREAFRSVYDRALSLYFTGNNGARGCFLIGTALTESVLDPEVRNSLGDAFREIDKAFEARLRFAQEHGELSRDTDATALAKLASAVLHTLAIRSRAGEARRALESIIEPALDLI